MDPFLRHAIRAWPPRAARQSKAALPRLTYLTGFEGTQMFGHGTDVLDTTEHVWRYRDDLALLAGDGISSVRACIPWHKVEAERDRFDWTWTDSYLAEIRRLGLDPIVDPLHHTSFPSGWSTASPTPGSPRPTSASCSPWPGATRG